MPFLLVGAGWLVWAGGDKDDKDTSPADKSQGRNAGGKALTAILGLGVLALGGGV